MKLVTFQSMEALKNLINKGNLICEEKYIDKSKMGVTYNWVLEKMNKSIKNNVNAKYPIWCWVKCYNNICPPKHKGEKIEGFDVKITFHKKENEIFITDFRRYSFLLSNMYIPDDKRDYKKFEEYLKEKKITKEDLKAFVRKDKYNYCREDDTFKKVCLKIRDSFDKCITTDSDILQGCIWNINLNEVEKIEILKDDGYKYGSLNYVRSNGKRMDWIADFYKKLD